MNNKLSKLDEDALTTVSDDYLRDYLRVRLEQALWLAEEYDAICGCVPTVYYMDPPDGGDVPISEQVRRMSEDAARYQFLRDSRACSMSINFNDHHSYYEKAEQVMSDNPSYYEDVPDDERQKMIKTDTIWTVHIYPRTPVSFDVFHASTLDGAVDAARSDS